MQLSPWNKLKLIMIAALVLIILPVALTAATWLGWTPAAINAKWWIVLGIGFGTLAVVVAITVGAIIQFVRKKRRAEEVARNLKRDADPASNPQGPTGSTQPPSPVKGKEPKAPSPRDEAESTFGAAIKWILLIMTGLVLPYIVFWLPLKMVLNKKWNWFVKGLAYAILLAIGFNAVGLTWKYWPEVKVWLATHDLVLKRTDITRTERSTWFYQKTFNPSTRYELPQVAPATVVQIVEWNDQIVHFRVSWRTTMGGDKTSDFRWDKLTQAMGEWVIYPEGANRGKWHMKADGPGRFVGSEQDTAGIWHSFKLWRKSETLSMVQ